MTKVAFVLPMPTVKIVGGYKVVYEYANYLANHGHEVTIFYNSNKGENAKSLSPILVYLLRNIICKVEPRWFNLSSMVKKINLYSLTEKAFLDYDVVIATAAETAVFVNTLKHKKKIYLIQGYESGAGWQLSKKELLKTYAYDMNICVVSRWLENKVKKYSKYPPTYISNGIDENIFFNQNLQRQDHSVAVLYSSNLMKGFDISLKVIKRLKKRYPDLIVNVFGTAKRPSNWPSWFRYKRFARSKDVAELMNKSKVFMCTSRNEGFGLTGLESLFCGCLLVTTDCGGIREYASESNALICKIDDVNEIYDRVCEAFDNKNLVSDLKDNTLRQKFSLKNSEKKFDKFISKGHYM